MRGSGLFSLLSRVLVNIKKAITSSQIPIVDFEKFPTVYNERHEINSTKNSFLYFFDQISDYDLDDVYKHFQYRISGTHWPSNATKSVSSDIDLLHIYKKYIKFNSITDSYISEHQKNSIEYSKTLGVHFRGNEMRTASGHPYPPPYRLFKQEVIKILDNYEFDSILLVTEDQKYLNKFQRDFGNRIISYPVYRRYSRNSYKNYPRNNHFYKLGLEIILQMLELKRCSGLLHSGSNVTEFSILLNNNNYVFCKRINLGTNSNNFLKSKYSWYLKSALPRKLKGFN